VVAVQWPARWFDGRTSRAHEALVGFDGSMLAIQFHDTTLEPLPLVAIGEIQVGEYFYGSARKLQLPDGSTLQVQEDNDGGFERALREQGYRPAPASRLMRTWPGALVSLVLLIAFVVWMDRQGAGLLANIALPMMPHAVDDRVGATVEVMLERSYFAPTQVSEERQRELRLRAFRTAQPEHRDLDWRLEFRNMRNPDDAFNALTLPNGTIVLLDGLTVSLTDEQLLAVIGHELGHVVHRHTMQRVMRQLGLVAVAGVVLGDVSTLAAAATAGIQDLHYQRDAEREADVFAAEFLRKGGLPVNHLADAFEVMRAEESSGDFPGFLSSHPPTEERARTARETPE
jgi:Zn-dependent protease with chaperone function